MGWLRLVGSIKLQVSLAEYSLFYRSRLKKRPMIVSILLTQATPHIQLYITIYTIVHIELPRRCFMLVFSTTLQKSKPRQKQQHHKGNYVCKYGGKKALENRNLMVLTTEMARQMQKHVSFTLICRSLLYTNVGIFYVTMWVFFLSFFMFVFYCTVQVFFNNVFNNLFFKFEEIVGHVFNVQNTKSCALTLKRLNH